MRITLTIIISIILVSCGYNAEDYVRFETPQPDGFSNEKGIPKKIVGLYSSLNDSSKLLITSRLIINYSIGDYSGKLDSVDIKEIKGDTSYSVTDNRMKVDIKVKGDSAFQHWSSYDTIFDAASGDIIRKFKGRYFLNKQIASNSWRVMTLMRIDNGVTLGTVSTKEEIDKLRELTGIKSDSVFSFRPTKKELKKFLKENGFSAKDTYLKIK